MLQINNDAQDDQVNLNDLLDLDYEDFVNLLNRYPQAAHSVVSEDNAHMVELLGLALELATEAAEAAQLVKKALRSNGDYDPEKFSDDMVDELGDVLWAVTALLNATNPSEDLFSVAARNQHKLAGRLTEGTVTAYTRSVTNNVLNS